MDVNEIGEEHRLLLRDLRQAAKTVLDVGGDQKYGVRMFLLMLQREALDRHGKNRCHAAKALGIHRNTLTRQLPPEDRKAPERFKKRPPARTVRIYQYPALPGIQA